MYTLEDYYNINSFIKEQSYKLLQQANSLVPMQHFEKMEYSGIDEEQEICWKYETYICGEYDTYTQYIPVEAVFNPQEAERYINKFRAIAIENAQKAAKLAEQLEKMKAERAQKEKDRIEFEDWKRKRDAGEL